MQAANLEAIRESQALLRLGRVDEAASAARRVLQTEPGRRDAWLLLGRAEMARERFGEARDAFRKAVDLYPREWHPRFLLGFCLYVENDFALAAPELEAALRLAPGHGLSLLYLALTEHGLGNSARAAALFEKARAAAPKDAGVLVAYGRFLNESRGFPKGEAKLWEALRLDPQSRDAHYEMARTHLEMGNAAQAVAAAELALQLPGAGATERQLHFLLARGFAMLGEREKAERHRRTFEAIPPRLIR
jgi:tetratricopeptide (TPR) repeat protein